MKVFIFASVFVAFFSVIRCTSECIEKACFKWPGCEPSFDKERCRCQSICERSDKECPKTPCLSTGFCYAYRRVKYNCQCVDACKEVPHCRWGYGKCTAWDNCSCKPKPESSEWSTSSGSQDIDFASSELTAIYQLDDTEDS